MNILYIEPFYAGSHKQWIDSYQKLSKYNIDILSLPGRFWKWRMHGGAITLAKKFINNNKKYNIIIASDMLNLPLFVSLCHHKIQNTKIITYFHENQILYSQKPIDEIEEKNRDLHYAFINYTSSLVSDVNLFNSNYHYNIYFKELGKYLHKKPEYKNKYSIEVIKNKSSVLHIGCDLKKFSPIKIYSNEFPVILWNHRWEHDKNPELFFNTLMKLKENNIRFSLVVLGQRFSRIPEIFRIVEKKLKSEILHFGYCDSFEDYKKWMHKADILPITSYQDFFGISIVESVYCNTIPLLPNRLSYPGIFDRDSNKELFYNTEHEFHSKLLNIILNLKELKNKAIKYKELVSKFDWNVMKIKYDKLFRKLA